MGVEQKVTFCRICEPLCGMIATVDDGRLVSLRPDKDHPLSTGFACQKGIAFAEVVNDPDRVTSPLRRRADGRFEPVEVQPEGRPRMSGEAWLRGRRGEPLEFGS